MRALRRECVEGSQSVLCTVGKMIRARNAGADKAKEEGVRRVVETSDKKRFEIKGRADEGLLIRASQGHSRDVAAKIDQHKLLTELQLEQAPAVCIHGTYSRVWPQIQAEGLKRMGRQHIHLRATFAVNSLSMRAPLQLCCIALCTLMLLRSRWGTL